MKSLSLFFFAGDFADAFMRYKSGLPQRYGTHDELCKLLEALSNAKIYPTVYSFMSDERREAAVDDVFKLVELGAKRWSDHQILVDAVEADRSDALIPHFANRALIRACLNTGRPTFPIMAASSNRPGLWQSMQRYLLARVLKDRRVSLASNHCLPATLQLNEQGVPAEVLIPWDIPHPHTPEQYSSKKLPATGPITIAYAGSISIDKGVGDLIRSLSHLPQSARSMQLRIAGSGAIDEMRALAAGLGVADQVDLLGLIDNASVIDLFRESHVVCVPSRHSFGEGFPLAMFEAIACRTPIICSDHPMFTPVMIDREQAMVFKQADPQSLASAISELTGDSSLYGRLSRNATESWKFLAQSADWRTMILAWAKDGPSSPWIRERTLEQMKARPNVSLRGEARAARQAL